MGNFLKHTIIAPVVSAILFFSLSGMVAMLNYCFPGSLDGTYLQLFFSTDLNV
ncbi:MAG: hypothetical protein ACRDEA_10120 [Microcystaceae cyanobacterium]